MELTIDAQELDRFDQEHAELDRQVDEWRTWWCELSEMGQPRFSEMGQRLRTFRENLAEHMRHEESSRYLQGLARGNPDHQDEAAQLWRGHHQLLNRLDALIARLSSCNPDYCCWSAARRDFEAWLEALHTHEREELTWMHSLTPNS